MTIERTTIITSTCPGCGKECDIVEVDTDLPYAEVFQIFSVQFPYKCDGCGASFDERESWIASFPLEIQKRIKRGETVTEPEVQEARKRQEERSG